MRLSVIIPTVGRASLKDALSSCADADEIVVVVDHANGPVDAPRLPSKAVLANVMGGDHGYTARTKGMDLASGTHLAFLDDDDAYTPGAVDLMRSHACDRPVLFRMDHPQHGVLWRTPDLVFGNVGTPMFLVPNEAGLLGEWRPHAPGLPEPGGDYTFIAGCVERMGDPVWRDEIVAIVRPQKPSLTVVTPWMNHEELWPAYSDAISVMRTTDRVIIVDNGSSPALPLDDWLRQSKVGTGVRYDENLGFSAASNHGLLNADTDAVVFLNNDIVMTDRRWLDAIRAELQPGVLVGSRIRYDRHGDVDGTPLPYLDGWCLAGMTNDLLEFGGFDEDYQEPAYFSDNDLCLRARAAGLTLREARVGLHHLTGVTAGPEDDPAKLAAVAFNHPRFVQKARGILDGIEATASTGGHHE